MGKIIGQLIEEEVRKQKWVIESFAKTIGCGRNNVYNIFKKSDIDIIQLAKISETLKHNFFEDLVSNPDLLDLKNPTIKKEFENKRALSQFWDVMPKVLEKLGFDTSIVKVVSKDFSENEWPDFGLSDFNVCFTLGEWLIERRKGHKLHINHSSNYSPKGIRVDFWEEPILKNTLIDVKLDYKSEEEWLNTMEFVKDECIPQAFNEVKNWLYSNKW
ncbi:MAG: hypothetical protein J6Z32_04425 [Bacteroidales bacterium]|nr:hypothetical protein [Bacteroidales bacterium]